MINISPFISHPLAKGGREEPVPSEAEGAEHPRLTNFQRKPGPPAQYLIMDYMSRKTKTVH